MSASKLVSALLLAATSLAGLHAAAGESPKALTPKGTDAGKADDGLIASPEPGWPQWRGPRRDGVSDEKGLLPAWPEGGPELLWKFGELGRGWSSPIVVGQHVYVTGDQGEDLVIFALDHRGNVQWRTTNGGAWNRSFPGARAACVYSESRLYHMNAHGRVACLEAASGKEIWAINVLDRFEAANITWAVSECLLVDGPRLIVTPGGRKALMAALDKATGRTVWTTEAASAGRTTHASPILFRFAGRRCLANCSSSHGFGVDADTGKLLWTVPLENRYGTNVSGPVYADGRIFYVTAYVPAALYRLRAEGQTVQTELAWTHPLDNCTGGALLAAGALYTSGYRRPKWWLSLDWKTGETRGELKGLTSGAAIYADGRLYVQAEDGAVALLRPTSGAPEIAGRFRLFARRAHDAWAHPVLLDGRLYLRYHDTLWCYDVRRK